MSYKSVKNVALFCNARDEKHIREWAAHHLLIGFNRIIIFDHNSVVPLSTVFQNFDKRVAIIRYDKSQNNVKIQLMNNALHIAKQMKVDWFIYLDADEYIILNNNLMGIKDLLNRYSFADSLALNWLMFGSNNLKTDPDDLILESYTKSELILDKQVKSFVRPFQATHSNNPHFYHIKNKSKIYALNTILVNDYSFNTKTVEYSKAPAFIAHYVYQSEETYINRKINLPRDDNGGNREKIDTDHLHTLHNSIENTFPKLKYAKNVRRFLQQYGYNF
jgi:predicted GNAT family N-acyltransferase